MFCLPCILPVYFATADTVQLTISGPAVLSYRLIISLTALLVVLNQTNMRGTLALNWHYICAVDGCNRSCLWAYDGTKVEWGLS